MAGDRTDIRKPSEDTRLNVRSGGIEIRRKGKPVRGAVSGADGVVYLAIDCSASMDGAKLIQAKQGALDFFNEARTKGYSVGLIRFETNARIVGEPQRELASLRRYVNELEIGGSTNMAAGIQLASNKLGAQAGPRAIVVVTDGLPNNREEALAVAQEAKNGGIDIITIGTEDADKAFLAKLATRSGLSVVVSDEDLGRGIASTAKMLPGLGSGQQVSGR